MEDTRSDGATPFMDTIITPILGATLLTGVFRDQYLQWDSHHDIAAKTVSPIHLHIGP